MTAWAYNRACIATLWRRELTLLVRQPYRVVASLGLPLLLGVAIALSTSGESMSNPATLLSGLVVLALATGSATGNVDLAGRSGLLLAVVVGPSSTAACLVGKALGVTTVLVLLAAPLLASGPLFGLALQEIDWLLLLGVLPASALGFAALGVALAWTTRSSRLYRGLAGGIFAALLLCSCVVFAPHEAHPAWAALMRTNPVTYAATGLKHALTGQVQARPR